MEKKIPTAFLTLSSPWFALIIYHGPQVNINEYKNNDVVIVIRGALVAKHFVSTEPLLQNTNKFR